MTVNLEMNIQVIVSRDEHPRPLLNRRSLHLMSEGLVAGVLRAAGCMSTLTTVRTR